MSELANCPSCGKVFVKTPMKTICGPCSKSVEEQLLKCIEYLRENKGATIYEVNEATDVPVKQIIQFVREGKISKLHAPNLTFPCEICGEPIQEGNICESCRQKLLKDVKIADENKERQNELERQQGHISYNIRDRLKDRR